MQSDTTKDLIVSLRQAQSKAERKTVAIDSEDAPVSIGDLDRRNSVDKFDSLVGSVESDRSEFEGDSDGDKDYSYLEHRKERQRGTPSEQKKQVADFDTRANQSKREFISAFKADIEDKKWDSYDKYKSKQEDRIPTRIKHARNVLQGITEADLYDLETLNDVFTRLQNIINEQKSKSLFRFGVASFFLSWQQTLDKLLGEDPRELSTKEQVIKWMASLG